jgi:pyrroline-5-carboxylate reductase
MTLYGSNILTMKIAIIGAGNMGGAIARGLAKGSIIKEEDL